MKFLGMGSFGSVHLLRHPKSDGLDVLRSHKDFSYQPTRVPDPDKTQIYKMVMEHAASGHWVVKVQDGVVEKTLDLWSLGCESFGDVYRGSGDCTLRCKEVSGNLFHKDSEGEGKRFSVVVTSFHVRRRQQD